MVRLLVHTARSAIIIYQNVYRLRILNDCNITVLPKALLTSFILCEHSIHTGSKTNVVAIDVEKNQTSSYDNTLSRLREKHGGKMADF